MLRPVRLTRGVPTTGALEATPTICMQQHDCVASLIGKASSENKGAGRIGVTSGLFHGLYSSFALGCVFGSQTVLMNFQVSEANAPKDSTMTMPDLLSFPGHAF